MCLGAVRRAPLVVITTLERVDIGAITPLYRAGMPCTVHLKLSVACIHHVPWSAHATVACHGWAQEAYKPPCSASQPPPFGSSPRGPTCKLKPMFEYAPPLQPTCAALRLHPSLHQGLRETSEGRSKHRSATETCLPACAASGAPCVPCSPSAKPVHSQPESIRPQSRRPRRPPAWQRRRVS